MSRYLIISRYVILSRYLIPRCYLILSRYLIPSCYLIPSRYLICVSGRRLAISYVMCHVSIFFFTLPRVGVQALQIIPVHLFRFSLANECLN